MAFLRKEKQKSGTYLSIAENIRNDSGKVKQIILYKLGKVEDYTPESLQRIAKRLYLLGGGNPEDLFKLGTREIARYNYGFPMIIRKLLKLYSIDIILERIKKKHRLSFNILDVLTIMICDRLNDPISKLATYNFQEEYFCFSQSDGSPQAIELQHIYRTLDKLSDYDEYLQKHIYEKNKTLFNYEIDLVFYDVTTLYFDSQKETEGALRQKGFSKDGKIGQTQVLFCLMIDRNKNPMGYRIYSGDKYEGHTFEESIKKLKEEYQIKQIVVVADRGMMNTDNIKLFKPEEGSLAHYSYIIGERLKNLNKEAQNYLINLNNYKDGLWKDEDGQEIHLKYCLYEYKGKTLIGSYSEQRAKKDKYDRENLLKKSLKLLKNPSEIEKKASRYFLKKQGQSSQYKLDEEKIKSAERYDGFLAIATNNKELPAEEALSKYKDLYRIEQSFRTFKSYLEIRPMFHWTDKRIKGHLSMCYISFCLLNYLQQKLKSKAIPSSENNIRRMFSKMQLSLLEQNGIKYYLRSAVDENTVNMLESLKLPLINDITPEKSIDKYFH